MTTPNPALISALEEWKNREFRNIEKERSFNRNHPFAFQDLGGFGEYLTLLMYPETIGSGSKGGCAFDNQTLDVNKKLISAREVKFCSLDGTKECNTCSCKAPKFQTRCLFCDGEQFVMKDDSRCGISASAHIEYNNLINEYTLFVSKYNETNDYIKLFCFKIDARNPYFEAYIQNQNDNGDGNTCNFQPFSWDFHMSGPIKLFDIDLFKDNMDILYYNLDNTENMPIPLKNWKNGRKIFTTNFLNKSSDGITEAMFGENGLDYLSYCDKIHRKPKALRKSRGKTSRIK